MLENPYDKIYQSLKVQVRKEKETEQIVKHLGFMYNTFGQAIKDLVKIIASSFQKQKEGKISATRVIRQQPVPTAKFEEIKNNDTRFTKNKCHRKPKKDSSKPYNTQSMCCSSEQIQLRNQIIASNRQSSEDNQNTLVQIQNQDRDRCLQFSLKIQEASSPVKQISQAYKQSNFFQLSHKQRFQDTEFLVIQQLEEEFMSKQFPDEGKKIQSEITKLENQTSLQNRDVRIIGGRKKKDRQKLMGVTCIQCQKYYKVMKLQGQSMCECTSRHKTNLPVKRTKNQFTQQFDLK